MLKFKQTFGLGQCIFANLLSYLFYFSQSIFESPPRRPVIGSAFTAYVPGKSGSRTSPAKQYTGLDNLRSRTSYLTSLGHGEER